MSLNQKKDREFALIPLTEWNSKFGFPTTAMLRDLVFYSTNKDKIKTVSNKYVYSSSTKPLNYADGFEKVIRRIGKRVFINVYDFFDWVEISNGFTPDRTKPFDELVLVTDWNKHFSYPNLSTLRNLINNAKLNGFDKVYRKVGGRVVIKVRAFKEWIDEINQRMED